MADDGRTEVCSVIWRPIRQFLCDCTQLIKGQGEPWGNPPLKQKLENGPLPVPEALDIAIQIAGGLARAHEHGIVHRDIKPSNVMVLPDGVVKVLDFGLAKIENMSLTRSGVSMGTPGYMAPEQVRGKKVDRRVDVWALGVVFYEMLAGMRPFRGRQTESVLYAIVHEQPEPLGQVRADLPPALAAIVQRAIEKAPEARYPQFDEMLKDLMRENMRLAGPLQEPRTTTKERNAYRRRSLGGLVAGIAVILLLIIDPYGVPGGLFNRMGTLLFPGQKTRIENTGSVAEVLPDGSAEDTTVVEGKDDPLNEKSGQDTTDNPPNPGRQREDIPCSSEGQIRRPSAVRLILPKQRFL